MNKSEKMLKYQGLTPDLFFDEEMSIDLKHEVARAVETQNDLWILAQLLMET